MSGQTVRVDGMAELRRTMKRAGADLSDLRELNMAAAQIVAAVAAARAPNRSGDLAKTVRPGATRTRASIRAGYARTPYAGVIHYGWPARNIAAQPWISEAAQSTEPRWARTYEQGVKRIIAKVQGA